MSDQQQPAPQHPQPTGQPQTVVNVNMANTNTATAKADAAAAWRREAHRDPRRLGHRPGLGYRVRRARHGASTVRASLERKIQEARANLARVRPSP